MTERLYLQQTDGLEYDPATAIAASLEPVTYGGRVALLAVPVRGSTGVRSGVYSDIGRAVGDLIAYDAAGCWSLYARLQPVLAGVPTTNALRPGPAVVSPQISALSRMLIEVDAPKPADGSAPTADAVSFAHDVATLIWAVLLRAGVPRDAMLALQSGHGVHLIIATKLSGSSADIQLWRDILSSLADALTRRGLGGELIDQGVADLTRSTRIGGTMNVKYSDEPAPVWMLRPWGGGTASLDVLEQLARRGQSLRSHAAMVRLARRRRPGAFAPDYRPAWVRELLTQGAPEGTRHEQCRRLVGWFVTYAPNEAEQAIAEFVAASRWDSSEANAVLRFYRRRTGGRAA